MPRNVLLSDCTEGEGVILTLNQNGIDKTFTLFVEMRINDFIGDTILILRYKRKYTRLKLTIRDNVLIDFMGCSLQHCSIKPARVVMTEKACPKPKNILETFLIINQEQIHCFFDPNNDIV